MVSGECRVHVGSIYQLDRFCMRGMGIGKSCVSICLGKHLSLRINLATTSVSEAVVAVASYVFRDRFFCQRNTLF